MIARLVMIAAGVAAAAYGMAIWAKRRTGRKPSERIYIPAVDNEDSDGHGESASEAGDDLQAIKGIGGVSEQRLSAIGVTTFAAIAAWSDDDVERVAKDIKISAERIKREDWVGQARAFAGA